MNAPHLSFTNFLPILIISLAKAGDDLTTFLLVNRFHLQGEANVISAWFYSQGTIGYLAIWAMFTGIFTAVYLIPLKLSPWKFRTTYKWGITIAVLTIILIPTVNNIAIWIWPN